MLSAIFIDVDNTLLCFDGYVKEAMRTGFEKFGLPPYKEEYYESFDRINDKYWEDIERGELTFAELQKIRWNRIFEEIGVTCDGEAFETFFRTYLNESAICEPGAEELLRHLCRKYVLCVASNGPYEQQIQRLKIGGLYEYFTYFFLSERIGFQKPSEKFFDACFRELNAGRKNKIFPEETMIIGDSLTSDIAGGKNYGMKTCFYNHDGKNEYGGANYVVTKLEQITKIL